MSNDQNPVREWLNEQRRLLAQRREFLDEVGRIVGVDPEPLPRGQDDPS